MNKRIVIAITALLVIISLITSVLIIAPCNKLVVSVPASDYFSEGVEEYGLSAFQKNHPEVNVQILVQKDRSNPFAEQADVYILSPQFFDVESLIQRDDCLVLDELISQDTKENLWCLDLLKNTNQQLVALPLFIGVYMINNSAGIGLECDATTPHTWRDIFDSYGECEVLTENTLLILTRQVEQLAYLTYTGQQSEGVLRNYLEDLKTLTGTSKLENGMYGTASMRTILVEHGMLCDWFQPVEDNTALYCSLPQYGQENLTPLAIRVGVIAKSTKEPELAVAFLESFVSVEAQLQLPTAGNVRSDMWQEINQQYRNNTEWSIENQRWWGMPVSAKTYQHYRTSINSGFVGCGSFQQTQEMTAVLWDYLSGNIPLETVVKLFIEAIIQRE